MEKEICPWRVHQENYQQDIHQNAQQSSQQLKKSKLQNNFIQISIKSRLKSAGHPIRKFIGSPVKLKTQQIRKNNLENCRNGLKKISSKVLLKTQYKKLQTEEIFPFSKNLLSINQYSSSKPEVWEENENIQNARRSSIELSTVKSYGSSGKLKKSMELKRPHEANFCLKSNKKVFDEKQIFLNEKMCHLIKIITRNKGKFNPKNPDENFQTLKLSNLSNNSSNFMYFNRNIK